MADGNLRGIRKWAWDRLAPTLSAPAAEDALNALHERPLTEQAKNRLTQARRNKYSLEDLAECSTSCTATTASSSKPATPTRSTSCARSE